MVSNKNESRNFNATSVIGEKTVMYMNASYNTSSEELSFNKSIRDTATYRANKETVDADYDSWCDEVYKSIFG